MFYLNATSQGLYPTSLDEVDSLELACSSTRTTSCFPPNHRLLAREILAYRPSQTLAPMGFNLRPVMPENTIISGRHSLRYIATRFRGLFPYVPDLTAATAPSAFAADAVTTLMKMWATSNTQMCDERKSFCYYNDTTYSVDALQVVIYAKCVLNYINSTLSFPGVDKAASGIYLSVKLNNSALG
jgi:hypothetical protein